MVEITENTQQSELGTKSAELDSLLKAVDALSAEERDDAHVFVQECKTTGCLPTLTEVTMRLRRNGFFYDDNFHSGRRSSLSANPTHALAVKQEAIDQVDTALNSWGEITGTVELELASQLYKDLIHRTMQMAPANEAEKIEDFVVTKALRDAFCLRQKGASALPLQQTLAYMAMQVSKEAWYNRLNPFKEKARHQFTSTVESMHRLGFTPGITSRIELEQMSGDCMIALLQEGGTEPVKNEVAQAVSSLYKFMGLERYGNSEVATQAISRVEEAIEPVKNDLLYVANRVLGPAPRPM